jgi:hypothetical protein
VGAVAARNRLMGGGEPAAVAQAGLRPGALGVREPVAGTRVGAAPCVPGAALRVQRQGLPFMPMCGSLSFAGGPCNAREVSTASSTGSLIA